MHLPAQYMIPINELSRAGHLGSPNAASDPESQLLQNTYTPYVSNDCLDAYPTRTHPRHDPTIQERSKRATHEATPMQWCRKVVCWVVPAVNIRAKVRLVHSQPIHHTISESPLLLLSFRVTKRSCSSRFSRSGKPHRVNSIAPRYTSLPSSSTPLKHPTGQPLTLASGPCGSSSFAARSSRITLSDCSSVFATQSSAWISR